MNHREILPAEYYGDVEIVDNELSIGGLTIPLKGYNPEGNRSFLGCYVRRISDNLDVVEVHVARHDGYAQEVLDLENEEANRYPLGAYEYWRSKMVDNGTLTQEEFDNEFWVIPEEGEDV